MSEFTVVGFYYIPEKFCVFSKEEDGKVKSKIIQIKDVKKAYKEVAVLKGVDLDVGQGEIFALLGSNGSGKTTMIRIMTT